MRRGAKYRLAKYSVAQKISNLPLRLLSFRRPKWGWSRQMNQRLQRSLANRHSLKFLRYVSVSKAVSPLKRWYRNKSYYKERVLNKNAFYFLYDKSINYTTLKGIALPLKEKNKSFLLVLGPLYILKVLLKFLFFFPSIYAASQCIDCGKVLVNNNRVRSNLLLQKGDVISLNAENLNCFKNLNSLKFNVKIFSFLEVDFKFGTVIVIKDLIELGETDLNLVSEEFLGVKYM